MPVSSEVKWARGQCLLESVSSVYSVDVCVQGEAEGLSDGFEKLPDMVTCSPVS